MEPNKPMSSASFYSPSFKENARDTATSQKTGTFFEHSSFGKNRNSATTTTGTITQQLTQEQLLQLLLSSSSQQQQQAQQVQSGEKVNFGPTNLNLNFSPAHLTSTSVLPLPVGMDQSGMPVYYVPYLPHIQHNRSNNNNVTAVQQQQNAISVADVQRLLQQQQNGNNSGTAISGIGASDTTDSNTNALVVKQPNWVFRSDEGQPTVLSNNVYMPFTGFDLSAKFQSAQGMESALEAGMKADVQIPSNGKSNVIPAQLEKDSSNRSVASYELEREPGEDLRSNAEDDEEPVIPSKFWKIVLRLKDVGVQQMVLEQALQMYECKDRGTNFTELSGGSKSGVKKPTFNRKRRYMSLETEQVQELNLNEVNGASDEYKKNVRARLNI